MALFKEKLELEFEELELRASQELSIFPKWMKLWVIGCLIAIIPAYFVAKSSASVVAKLKYGGYVIFARTSFTAPKNLSLGTMSITTTGNGVYAAAVPVTNQNIDLALSGVAYEIDGFNQNHSIVAKSKGVFYILPNQTKYVTAPRLVSPDPIVSAQIVFPALLPWKRNITLPTVTLTTGIPQVYNQSSPVALVVESSVENRSPYRLGKVTIVILLKDSSGKIIGISQREESTFAPQERRTFQQLWPGVYSTDIAKAELYAYTDTVDSSNVVAAPGSGSATDLGRPTSNN